MKMPWFLLKILSLVLVGPMVFAEGSRVNELLTTMSLEQKVEQLLVFGFSGTDFSSNLGPRLKSMRPGSFIVFSRNIKSPYELSKAISRAQREAYRTPSGLPLIFMVDQEGGQVTRIKTKPGSPSALSMGKTKDPKLIEQIGYTTGQVLQSIGINMNLAPVLDIADPNAKHFIGNRSFGSNPKAVANFGRAFSSGLIRSGVIPTAKHFPGHGGTTQDSHKVRASKTDSFEELTRNDLFPFAEYSKIPGVKALMVAHVSYPSLDPSGVPATFSKPIITNLLRDQLGYNGLVVTDDLEMSGAAGVGNVGERAIRSIEAGADLVMVAWSFKKQMAAKAALIKAFRSGRLSSHRLNDSVRRVLIAKLNIKSQFSSQEAPSINNLRKHLSRLKELSHRVSKLNFKADTHAQNQLPLVDESTPVYVFSADSQFFTGFKRYKDHSLTFYSLRSHLPKDINDRLQSNSSAYAVYYATGSVTARRLSQIRKTHRKRIVVINTTYPGLIDSPETFAAVINLNTRDAASGFWVSDVLFDDNGPRRIPSTEARVLKNQHQQLVKYGKRKEKQRGR